MGLGAWSLREVVSEVHAFEGIILGLYSGLYRG